MSIDVKYSVKIPQPVEVVFAAVTDIPRMVEWSTKEVRNISDGPTGVGTTFQLVADFMGADQYVNYRVIGFDPPNKFVYQSSGATANVITITFEPSEEGTKLIFELSVKVSGVFSPLVKGSIKKLVVNYLTRLAAMLEK